MNRRGFSLIELLVVLTLMAIVLCLMTIRWSDSLNSTKFEFSLESIINANDSTRRDVVQANSSAMIHVDLNRRKLVFYSPRRRRIVDLTNGIRIVQLRTCSGSYHEGEFEFVVGSDGSCPTWGFELTNDRQSKWIAFAGRTGQKIQYSTRKQFDALFESLKTQGIDAG